MLDFAEYGLDVAMYWCRRMYYGECQEVRILHASTYLHGTRPEVHKIIQYMNSEGFLVEHKQYEGREFRQEWSTADMLLLGCDSNETARAKEAITEMERGLLGVWRGYDVLWYFADGHVPSDARLHMNGSILCSNDVFSAEAICMVHAHLRRRFDVVSQRGLFVTMEQLIADAIDRLVAANPKYDEFGRKVNRLKNAKKKIRGGGRDWSLFFAATEFLMEVRNRSSHPKVTSSFENRMKSYKEFKETAFKYGLDLPSVRHGCPIETDSQNRHVTIKTCMVLTGMAKAWLDECDRNIWK